MGVTFTRYEGCKVWHRHPADELTDTPAGSRCHCRFAAECDDFYPMRRRYSLSHAAGILSREEYGPGW